MRKALLIDLYTLDAFNLSLALGTLKSHAEADPNVSSQWEIELLHLPARTDLDEVLAAIVQRNVALVGFSCFSWNIHAVERIVAKLPKKRDFVVILGGVEVSPDPMSVIRRNRNVDGVVFGEGEETFTSVLANLPEGASEFKEKVVAPIKGLAWRAGKTVRMNPARPPMSDLSTIPSPYLEGTYGTDLDGRERVMVETTRGCPYRCAYCYESRGFESVRTFPLDRVKEELAYLVKKGVKEIVFLDTNFNHDRERARDLLAYLKKLGGAVRYALELRAERLDPETCQAVGALDFFAEIGLQSTNPKALEAVNRTFDRKKFEAGVLGLLEASIYRPCSFSMGGGVTIDMMVGLPHDGMEDVLATFDYIFSLAPSKIAVSMTKVLPGTEMFDQARKYRYKFDTHNQYQVISTRTLSKKDVESLLAFRDAVDFVYNRVHAPRTLGWAAQDLKTKPSALLMELGRRMAKSDKPASQYHVSDLADLLAEICESRGSTRVADAVGGKLTSEGFLNVLQKWKEKRRSLFARMLFGAGRRFLSLVWGLADLPKPTP